MRPLSIFFSLFILTATFFTANQSLSANPTPWMVRQNKEIDEIVHRETLHHRLSSLESIIKTENMERMLSAALQHHAELKRANPEVQAKHPPQLDKVLWKMLERPVSLGRLRVLETLVHLGEVDRGFRPSKRLVEAAKRLFRNIPQEDVIFQIHMIAAISSIKITELDPYQHASIQNALYQLAHTEAPLDPVAKRHARDLLFGIAQGRRSDKTSLDRVLSDSAKEIYTDVLAETIVQVIRKSESPTATTADQLNRFEFFEGEPYSGQQAWLQAAGEKALAKIMLNKIQSQITLSVATLYSDIEELEKTLSKYKVAESEMVKIFKLVIVNAPVNATVKDHADELSRILTAKSCADAIKRAGRKNF